MRFGHPQPLTTAQQFVNLRANPISVGGGRLHGNMLSWSFAATPTPISRCYRARIDYRQDKLPQVYIDDPDLTVLAAGRRLPHVYDQSPTRLCLFLPGTGEWGPWMRLDQTVVPWTALWLLYFEEWLFSEEWAGGGLHPVVRERGSRRSGRSTARQARPVEALE